MKALKWLCLVSFCLLPGTFAHGAILLKDTFSYSDGDMAGRTPLVGGSWTVTGTNNATNLEVIGGEARLSLSGNILGGAARDSLAAQLQLEGSNYTSSTGDQVFIGFDIRVTTTGGGAFPIVLLSENGALPAVQSSRIIRRAGSAAGTFQLVAANDGAVNGNGEIVADNLTLGTSYRLVARYDHDTGATAMWLGTGSNTLSFIGTATDPGATTPLAMSFLSLRQGFASGGGVQFIDNLVVATSFGEAAVIPEPTIACLLVPIAMGLVRRR